MTSRRSKLKRDAKLIEEGRYMRQVESVLVRLLPELQAFSPSLVRTRHSGPFGGAPTDFGVSFVFTTRAEAQRAQEAGTIARAAERVRAALRSDGYPKEAIDTFRYHILSEEEIADAGGEWLYDRT